ncbi:MAG: putative methyltransferase [Acinetobacter bereziniae]|uniref:Putative methyltransferase n=1 Tax=Acinetobacter bereziniae TaxID=106648 RepID=A0A833US54_ACIBZ|nr:MAG: putative methyltransferase [Acinetobacter bereziniae]
MNEIHHILKSDGHLGLVWNQRDENIAWVKALADLLATIEGDTPRYHSGQWKQVFENQLLFQLETAKVFSQQHTGTVENVVSKRLLSNQLYCGNA